MGIPDKEPTLDNNDVVVARLAMQFFLLVFLIAWPVVGSLIGQHWSYVQPPGPALGYAVSAILLWVVALFAVIASWCP
jgi:hypothetical protein